MLTTRRGLITGLTSFLAAPAIVRASSLMPVKAWVPAEWHDIVKATRFVHSRGGVEIDLNPGALNYAQPYSGWRFRFENGIVFHEPDIDAASAA